jgi:hypothetical protein
MTLIHSTQAANARPARPSLRRMPTLLADRRAGMTVFIAGLITAMIVFGAFVLDSMRLMVMAQRLNQATEMAALAGGTELSTYYTTSATTTLTTAANSLFNSNVGGNWANTPSTTVSVGSWSSSNFTANTTPNAVQVIGTATVNTIFGAFLGKTSFPITKTAVARIGGARAVNVVVVNDTSGSFSGDITQQRAADQAILNCIASSATGTSKFGISTFDGTSATYIPLTTITAAAKTSMTTKINAMLSCSGGGTIGGNPPKCSGTNAAGGIYNARTQLDALNCPKCNNNIVIITDGVPNYNPISYTQAAGTYVSTTGTGTAMVGTGSATTAMCGVGSTNSCSTPTNSNGDPVRMLAMAQGQAAAAGASGYLLSTIYYTGDTSGSTLIAAYTTELKNWTKNGGVAMVAPTPTQITSSSNGVCALLGVGLAKASASL